MKKIIITLLLASMTTACLFAAGCGKTENADVENADAENSTTSEIELSIDNQEESQDITEASQNSSLSSNNSFTIGRYQIQDAEGSYYQFNEDGSCYYLQMGTYTFSTDLNTDGQEADLLNMQFDLAEIPTVYTIEGNEEGLSLRTTNTGDQGETIVTLTLLEGQDVILQQEAAEGSYMAYDSSDYIYEFYEDGTFCLKLIESYSLSGDTISLAAFGSEFTYQLVFVDGNYELKEEDQVIATLIPVE